MARGRITTTLGFETQRANAEVLCTRCGHKVVIKGAEFARMFAEPVGLEWARCRMRCKSCGSRAAEITPVFKPPRD
jgi:DNA-directed RNA polymerase subunit RPC12/RpoP